ncbi:DnaB-like helicase N-terminal domain-containing protein, partial [Chromobacterium piscinae]
MTEQYDNFDSEMASIRTPPHSVEAEQSVLGGLLLDNSAWDKIADVVSEADFYRHDHRLVYKHIAKLVEMGRPADVVTVSEALDKNGELAEIGGLAYLATLAQNT